MKAEFIVKAECTMETDEKQTGEEISSYIKGLLRAAGINAKVLIGYLKYEGGEWGLKDYVKDL